MQRAFLAFVLIVLAGIVAAQTSKTYVSEVEEGSGGGAAWGDITGTLSDQTDLQTALDGKEASGTFSGTGACASNQWASTLNDGLAPTCTQPGFSNLSGAATDSQVPDDITVSLAATATALAANGGNCSGNNFALGVSASGVGECAQPAFSNLSGAATGAQLPNPGASSKGGVQSLTCSGTDKLSAIGTDGVPVCSADQEGAGGGGDTYVVLGSSVASTASTSYQNIAGLSWNVAANTRYDIECHIRYDASATTVGLGISWDGPASPAFTSGRMVSGLTAATIGGTTVTGDDTGGSTTASVGTADNNHADFHGFWANGANAGTLQMRFRPETATANGIVILAGSFCKYGAY